MLDMKILLSFVMLTINVISVMRARKIQYKYCSLEITAEWITNERYYFIKSQQTVTTQRQYQIIKKEKKKTMNCHTILFKAKRIKQ